MGWNVTDEKMLAAHTLMMMVYLIIGCVFLANNAM
jgi:hypothetical protein